MYLEYEFEEWAPIEGYPNYEISNHGRVWNVKFQRFIKPTYRRGYAQVNLSRNGVANPFAVHRLVAFAFLEQRIGAEYVNHDDGDKGYNCIENLEWCTRSENDQHAYDTGLRVPPHRKAIEIVETGERFDSISECARTIGAHRENIIHCLSGKRRRTLGYTFRYADV